jgi:archaeosine synthase beta-subunit
VERYSEALNGIRGALREMKRNVRLKEFDADQPASTDVQIGHLQGKPIEKFVVHFRSTGCLWDKQTGGCTMCGFWNETAQYKRSISTPNFVNQFLSVLKTNDLHKYPVLSLSNGGSFFAEPEIPFSAAEQVFSLVAKHLPDVKRVIVDSKAEYVDRNKLRALQKRLGNAQLAIGIGFESQDDVVRTLCVNKGSTKKDFENCIELTKDEGVHSIVSLLIKPPFLTEGEAIDEAIVSAKYVDIVGANEITFEALTAQRDTFVNLLYQAGRYRLPWLWSISEVLRAVRPFARPLLTPFRYIVGALDTPRNCATCTPFLIDRIYDKYCTDLSISHLQGMNCPCQKVWQHEVEHEDSRTLPERVLASLKVLNVGTRRVERFDSEAGLIVQA